MDEYKGGSFRVDIKQQYEWSLRKYERLGSWKVERAFFFWEVFKKVIAFFWVEKCIYRAEMGR